MKQQRKNSASNYFNYGEHTIRPNMSDEHFTLLDIFFSCLCESDSSIGNVLFFVSSTDSKLIKDNPPSMEIAKTIVTIPISTEERFIFLNC